MVLGEEQPEEVELEVSGSRTEQRSRGRRAQVTAAAETETVERQRLRRLRRRRRLRRQTRLLAGGSSPLALKAPRSFPRVPGALWAAAATRAQRSPLDRRSESAKILGAHTDLHVMNSPVWTSSPAYSPAYSEMGRLGM